MVGGGLLHVLLFLKLCEIGSPILTKQSAKIVTPTNANPQAPSMPAAPAAPASGGAGPQQQTPTGTVPGGTGGTIPSGSSPPGGTGVPSPGTASAGPPAGGSTPSGTQTNGASPPSGTPPNGASPPGGGTSPNGASPPGGGAPPNGASPPSGSPPPIMGSIVAGPDIPSRSLPANNPSGTDGGSAEVVDNSIDTFDKRCDYYYSMLQSPATPPPRQTQTPIVMIYGGTNSAEREFPHMASLGYGESNAKQWLCAGSLIATNFVVTAAHCLSAVPLGEVRYVKLGNTRLDQDTQNTQSFNIVKRTAHEQYDPHTQYNDIALLQLDGVAHFNEYVMPICLFSSTNYEDRNLIATGWGKTETGTVSKDLKKVGLELFSQSECQAAYSAVPKSQLPLGIQELTQVCAGSRTESKDTCQGDSGGPLQIRKNNRWYLIGITSIGIQCGNINSPGVYTRVAYFLTWIQENVWNK